MPLCSLHLIRLHSSGNGVSSKKSLNATRARFLQQLLSSPLGSRILVACVIRRPVILANRIDPVFLNATRWDLLILIAPDSKTASPLILQDHTQTQADISAEYALNVGVPSRILDNYAERTKVLNEKGKVADKPSIESLLTNPARTHPGYKPKTSQMLEMSDDLVELIEELEELGEGDGLVDARGPVHQLNLLCFKKTEQDKERYHKYGQVSVCVCVCVVQRECLDITAYAPLPLHTEFC